MFLPDTAYLDVVEPGVDLVVLLHEVVEGPDLEAEVRHVPLVPAELPRVRHAGVRPLPQIVLLEVGQDRVPALLRDLVLVIF